MSELLNLSNSIAASKASILSALEDRGVTVSSATKLEDVPTLINNMVVSGTGDSVLATNLTGSNIAIGDKVYLKQQVAQQEGQDTQVNANTFNFSIINTAGSKIIYYSSGTSYEYDIANNTSSQISNLDTSMWNDKSVVKYEGSRLFINGYVILDSINPSPFYRYAQDHYVMGWQDAKIQKYNDDFTTVLQEWTLSGLSNTNDIMEVCVVGNKLHIIKYENYYVKGFSGTIDENSATISMTEKTSFYYSSGTSSFCFNKIMSPVVTTSDNKVAFAGNFIMYRWTQNDMSPGLKLMGVDSSYEMVDNFVTQNSDLTDFIASTISFTFNRGTNILTCRSDNKYGIFKYNPTTVDFDTLIVDSMSTVNYNNDKYLSVCNDVSRLCYNKYYRNMEVAAGGYNAIPYFMGQDIITGFAAEAAQPNDTFNVNTIVSGTGVDSKVIQATYNMPTEAHAGDKVFVTKGGAWAVEDDYVIDSLSSFMDSSYYDVWSGTLLDDVTTPGDTVRVRLQGAKLPWVTVTVNTTPADADVVISWSNRFIDDTGEIVYDDAGNVDRVLTYTDLTIQASKSGYEDATEYVSVEDEDVTVNIELQPS